MVESGRERVVEVGVGKGQQKVGSVRGSLAGNVTGVKEWQQSGCKVS